MTANAMPSESPPGGDEAGMIKTVHEEYVDLEEMLERKIKECEQNERQPGMDTGRNPGAAVVGPPKPDAEVAYISAPHYKAERKSTSDRSQRFRSLCSTKEAKQMSANGAISKPSVLQLETRQQSQEKRQPMGGPELRASFSVTRSKEYEAIDKDEYNERDNVNPGEKEVELGSNMLSVSHSSKQSQKRRGPSPEQTYTRSASTTDTAKADSALDALLFTLRGTPPVEKSQIEEDVRKQQDNTRILNEIKKCLAPLNLKEQSRDREQPTPEKSDDSGDTSKAKEEQHKVSILNEIRNSLAPLSFKEQGRKHPTPEKLVKVRPNSNQTQEHQNNASILDEIKKSLSSLKFQEKCGGQPLQEAPDKSEPEAHYCWQSSADVQEDIKAAFAHIVSLVHSKEEETTLDPTIIASLNNASADEDIEAKVIKQSSEASKEGAEKDADQNEEGNATRPVAASADPSSPAPPKTQTTPEATIIASTMPETESTDATILVSSIPSGETDLSSPTMPSGASGVPTTATTPTTQSASEAETAEEPISTATIKKAGPSNPTTPNLTAPTDPSSATAPAPKGPSAPYYAMPLPPLESNFPKEDITDSTISKTHYEILQVSHICTVKEVKKAYRKMALKHHPDRNSNPDAVDNFNFIRRAYGVLSDDLKRMGYDAELRLVQLRKEEV